MLALKQGDTIACGLVVHFDYGGSSYRLAMNPGGPSGYADTGMVSVSCTSALQTVCNGWTVEETDGGSVGKRLRLTTVKGKTTTTDLGNYRFSFSIKVTNP
jgi:hypothetical protein